MPPRAGFLADPLAFDTAEPDTPMAQLAFVMLALFGQMERTYAAERASHAPGGGHGQRPTHWPAHRGRSCQTRTRLPLPDGIICHSDSVAFGLYRALRIHGLGAETRVIGYDNIGGAALWEPPLTSVATQGEALGRRAARMLLERIKEPGAPTSIDKTIPELAVRQSCGCP